MMAPSSPPPPWRWQADATAGLASPSPGMFIGGGLGASPGGIRGIGGDGGGIGARAATTTTPGGSGTGTISHVTAHQVGVGIGLSSSQAVGQPGGGQPGQAGTEGKQAKVQVYGAEESNSAWKHVKKVIGDDGKGSPDLYNLLLSSPLESGYSFHQAGWPGQLRSLSPVMADFPPLVVDRHNSCNLVCFCGAFPSIKRAWASVDNSLFLWRYDRRNDVPIEYSGEEAAICAVGLVKPHPGVFVEAIQHVLVLCTTVEIVLLGVCCSKGPGGSGDEWQELSLQPLPLYTISSDNVIMTCVASTNSGRIFLGGSDGHLYEMLYSSGDSWRQRRCSKVCHSGGIGKMLPSLLQSLMLSKLTAIVEIAIDEDRHILYTRSQGSANTTPSIQVWDLGAGGSDTPRWVAKCSDIAAEAYAHARYGRELFGRAGGAKAGLAYISPIPPHDSRRLHLLAVMNDGRRVYFTTCIYESGRPQFLKAEFVRAAIPRSTGAVVGRVGAAAMAGLEAPSSRGVQVTGALYSSGALLLSEAQNDRRATKLMGVVRDLTAPAAGPMMGGYPGPGSSLREMVMELDDCHIPGEAMSIVPVPNRSAWQHQSVDHLSTQHLHAPQRFVLISTTGVLELERRRPVDVLCAMLEERSTDKMEQFFKSYGAGESAAMCLMLIIAPIGQVSTQVAQGAQQVFESPHFTGEPGIVENGTTLAGQEPASSAFYMGRPVLEPQFKSSGAHEGLCLVLARLVRPMWDKKVMVPVAGGSGFMKCPWSIAQLEEAEEKLRALQRYLGSYLSRHASRGVSRSRNAARGSLWAPSQANHGDAWSGLFQAPADGSSGDGAAESKRRRLEDAFAMEERSVRAVRSCVGRTAEALHLLAILVKNHIGRLVARLPEGVRGHVAAIDLRELVCSQRGEEVAAHLISALVTEHLSAEGGVADHLATALGTACPSFFKEDDRVFYKASGLLQKAESSEPGAAKGITNEALGMLMRVPLACSLGVVVPQLSQLGCYQGVVELPLRAAAAVDPGNLAMRAGSEGEAARGRREACYTHILSVLRFLVKAETEKKQQRSQDRKALIKVAVQSGDPYFHEVLYREMVALGLGTELLQLDANASYLETYLLRAGGLDAHSPGLPLGPLSPEQLTHLDLLAKFYVTRANFSSAAQVYASLAERRSGAGDQQVTLAQRWKCYESAVLQAKSQGDTDLIEDFEAKLTVMGFQKTIAERVAGGGEQQAADSAALNELQAAPKSLSQLFNDYAKPREMWDVCLEVVGFSTHSVDSADVVLRLWDWYLLQGASSSADSGPNAVLEEACARVERLGIKFYTNDAAFPMEHVTLRLHQIAAGLWPERDYAAPVVNGPQRVATAVVQSARGSADKVKRTYDALLRRREGEPFGRELQRSDMRLQMMQAMLEVATSAKDMLREQYEAGDLSARLAWSRESREAGQLAEMCERYAMQAGRLQGVTHSEAETLAAAFKSLRDELEGFVSRYRYN